MKELYNKLERVLRRSKKAVVIMGCLLAVGIVAGIYIGARRPVTKVQPNDGVITYSTDKPSEKRPEEEGYVWAGGPNDPKEIVIESIGVKGFIQKVGVDQNRRIAVPNNVHLAAWFVDSVRPGEQGLSIIDGHIVDQSDLGIFTKLSSLQIGDRYTITFGDGGTKLFEVVDVQSVPVEKAEPVLFSQNPSIRNQLNLITCGGTYNQATRSFNERVIVISEYLQG